jgi:cytidylate kinase
MQRAFARRGRTVLAGRDIGEVVVPEAQLKLYLEADEDARARRRSTQRAIADTAGERESHSALSRRDRLDAPQTYIPPDAVVIDTTEMTLEEVLNLALEKVSCGN